MESEKQPPKLMWHEGNEYSYDGRRIRVEEHKGFCWYRIGRKPWSKCPGDKAAALGCAVTEVRRVMDGDCKAAV